MVNTILLSALGLLVSLRTSIMASFRNERGQDLIEYAVLAGAIGISAGAALFFFLGPDVLDPFAETIEGCITFDGDACDVVPAGS